MSAETTFAAIDMALERSEARCHVVFFGGEPTLMLDRIEDAMLYGRIAARRAGKTITYEVTTNGTRVTDRFLDLVKTFNVITAVSIDGPKEVHDTHRFTTGGRGSFALIDRHLDRVLEQIPAAIASSVVTPETVGRLSESVNYLIDRGFRIVVTSPDHSADWGPEHLKQLEKQLAKIGRSYARRVKKGQKFYLSCIDGAIRSHIRPDSERGGSCGAGRSHLSVAPDGRLFPCVQFVSHGADDWALGHVTTGVDEERIHSLGSKLSGRDAECGECALRSRCASGCPCANLAATGSPNQVSGIQCAAQRAAIPTADRVAEKLYRERNKGFIHKHYNRLYPVALCVEDGLIKKELKDAGI